MSAPQMKERPASLLRAMFAGFGSLMSVVDKVRSKPAAEAPAAATPSAAPEATVTPTETAASMAAAAPEAADAPAAPAPEPATETPVAETAAPEASAATETVAAAEPAASEPAASEPSGELPLANYDELTVASLRARLRNLSNDDLTQLMTYEKAHQNRPEVIKMFQNRLIKMTSGLPKLES